MEQKSNDRMKLLMIGKKRNYNRKRRKKKNLRMKGMEKYQSEKEEECGSDKEKKVQRPCDRTIQTNQKQKIK